MSPRLVLAIIAGETSYLAFLGRGGSEGEVRLPQVNFNIPGHEAELIRVYCLQGGQVDGSRVDFRYFKGINFETPIGITQRSG